MQIKNVVQNARKQKNLTQQQLAELVDVSRRTIISLEKGNYTPSLLLALQLAEVLEVTVHELFFIQREE
ncbi:MAG: helix-turn-helix transcriptional regulator [Lysinibacillus sp.]